MSLSRRGLLTLAGMGAVGASAALAGCGPTRGPAPQPPPASVDLRSVLPAHIPLQPVKPDLVAKEVAGADAYRAMPQQPTSIIDTPPGKGGRIRFLGLIPTPPAPLAQNSYWQELNQRLGAEVVFEGVPNAHYTAKFQTVIAGGDLPDLMQLRSTIPKLPPFVTAKCMDLTDVLAGDGIKKYPALASIPTSAWRAGVYQGRLYGVPAAKNVLFGVPVVRGDLLEAAKVSPDINSGEELLTMLSAINAPKDDRWAVTAPYDMLNYLGQMLKVPNEWRLDGGKLVRSYETPEFEEALRQLTEMWQKGLLHPESFDTAKVQSNIVSWLNSGTINFFVTSPYWGSLAINVEKAAAGQTLVPVRTPLWDGSGLAARYLVPGATSVTAITSGSAGRVEELLGVLNWAAAPFGTAENLFRDYGREGTHFTWQDGAPIKTDLGAKEVIFSTRYLADSLRPHHLPGRWDLAEAEFAAEQDGLSRVVENPVEGLYSPTAESQGAAADIAIRDAIADIVQQRRKPSDWAGAVATWRQKVGDAARGEYETALAE